MFEFAYADGEALQTGRANSRGQLFSLSEGAASSPLLPNLPDIATTPEDPNLQRSGFGPTAHAATARSGTLRMIDLEADASTGRFPAAFETFRTDLRATAERGRTAQPRGAYLQIRPIPAGTRPPQGAPTINIEALSSISAQAIRTLIERPYYFHRLTDSLPDDVSEAPALVVESSSPAGESWIEMEMLKTASEELALSGPTSPCGSRRPSTISLACPAWFAAISTPPIVTLENRLSAEITGWPNARSDTVEQDPTSIAFLSLSLIIFSPFSNFWELKATPAGKGRSRKTRGRQ
ncbi:MAG: hypothetical protein AAFR50_04895 [Pseudomonadota bacterium]